MYNSKRYDISDVAQPAYIVKNNSIVNPAYPTEINEINHVTLKLPDTDFLTSLKRGLKYAKKKNDRRKIRAIKTMLREIKEYEHEQRSI